MSTRRSLRMDGISYGHLRRNTSNKFLNLWIMNGDGSELGMLMDCHTKGSPMYSEESVRATVHGARTGNRWRCI